MHVAPSTVPTASEIEAIVRAVLQRLQTHPLAPLATGSSPVPSPAASAPAHPSTLRLDQPLLTLEDLRERWGSLQVLEVPSRCVITPAVHDECRRHGIRLVRYQPQSLPPESQSLPQPSSPLLLLVPATSKSQVRSHLKTTGAQVATVGQCDKSSLDALRSHLQDPQASAIWSAPRPFAALRACGSLSGAVAVQLSQLNELPQAIEEAQPNLLIVDDHRWTASGVAQLAQAWLRKLGHSLVPSGSHRR